VHRLVESIRALDSIEGSVDEDYSRLKGRLDQLSLATSHCKVESVRSVETIPRCVACNFKLGEWPRNEEALGLQREAKRQFKITVANFCKKLMARLIKLKSEAAFVEAILAAAQSYQPIALDKAVQEFTERGSKIGWLRE